MFLIECWMPVTAWPMAANFCAWISSRCSRFSWVMSLLMPIVPIPDVKVGDVEKCRRVVDVLN